MITLEKLKIFQQYRGDGDHYARVNFDKDGHVIYNGDFSTIDSMLQDIEMIEKGLLSQTYLKALNRELVVICDSVETVNELKRIANKTNFDPIQK